MKHARSLAMYFAILAQFVPAVWAALHWRMVVKFYLWVFGFALALVVILMTAGMFNMIRRELLEDLFKGLMIDGKWGLPRYRVATAAVVVLIVLAVSAAVAA